SDQKSGLNLPTAVRTHQVAAEGFCDLRTKARPTGLPRPVPPRRAPSIRWHATRPHSSFNRLARTTVPTHAHAFTMAKVAVPQTPARPRPAGGAIDRTAAGARAGYQGAESGRDVHAGGALAGARGRHG